READRGHAVARAATADLRRTRARRGAFAGQGDPDRQRADGVHPALPRAVGVITVLDGHRHRPRERTDQGDDADSARKCGMYAVSALTIGIALSGERTPTCTCT